MASGDALSAEEQTRYDRQVRLWGVDAQLRMMKSKVLVVTLHGLGTEIVKNLVLGGVGSVALCDVAVATQADSGSNFLLSGKECSRAESCVSAFKEMNSLVKLSTVDAHVDDIDVRDYDVVIATDLCRAKATKLNEACRSHRVCYIACNSFGLMATSYADFGDDFSVCDPSDKEKRRKISTPFESLNSVYGRKWTGNRFRPSFIAAAALWEAGLCANGSLPDEEAAMRMLRDAWSALSKTHDLPADLLSDTLLRTAAGSCVGSYMPVCAVAGGVVAQEALKAIQRNAKPVVGFFVYDGATENMGYEQRIV